MSALFSLPLELPPSMLPAGLPLAGPSPLLSAEETPPASEQAPEASGPAARGEAEALADGRVGAGAVYDGAAAPVPAVAAAELLERGAFELQQDVLGVFASLARVHAAEQGGAPASGLAEPKRELLGALEAAARALGVPSGDDFPAARRVLAERRVERDAAEQALLEARRAGAWSDREAAGRRLAELHRQVLAAQVAAARLILLGRSGLNSKPFRRNAALWTLAGAIESAAGWAAQARWFERARRLRTALARADGSVSIERRRWISVTRRLRGAARDARNGRAARARETTLWLAGLYEPAPAAGAPVLPRAYARTAAALRAAAAELEGADPAGAAARLEEIAAGLSHPRVSVPQATIYADRETAGRSIGHEAESLEAEHSAVAGRLAELEAAADLLGSGVAQAGMLGDTAPLLARLADVQAWAERGSVRPKQQAARALRDLREAAALSDWPLAARHAREAAGALRRRLADLERIAAAL